MHHQLTLSDRTPFCSLSLSLLNLPTLLLPLRPPAFLNKGPLLRLLPQLSRNRPPARPLHSLFKDNCLVPLTRPGKKLPLPVTLSRTVCLQTDHLWTSFRRKGNCLMIKKPTCLTMTNPSQRNNPTERL